MELRWQTGSRRARHWQDPGKRDTEKTDDMSVVTLNIIVSEDTDENPTASNSLNQERVKEDQEISGSTGRPAQDMNYGEGPDLEESNPQEAGQHANIRVSQGIPAESKTKAVTKQNSGLALKGGDAEDGIQIY